MARNSLTMEYAYAAVFGPAGEGGFVVTFPALPELVTWGGTLEEARSRAAAALRGYLEGLFKAGASIPADVLRPSVPVILETVIATI